MIPKKTTKMIVKDGNGDYLQLLPEAYTDSALNASSSDPISNAAATSALNAVADKVAELSLFKVMDEEPTALNTEGTADKAIFAWLQPESWSITIDTEAYNEETRHEGEKTGEVPFCLYNTQDLSFNVDWGDGTKETYSSEGFIENKCPKHEYQHPGIYNIAIESRCFSQMHFRTDANTFYHTIITINSGLPTLAGVYSWRSKLNEDNVFDEIFYGSSSLQHIPSDLFANNMHITSFDCSICECRSLQEIPSGLFANHSNVVNFDLCFAFCTIITSIPEDTFAGCTAAETFDCTFEGCFVLESIPENLFRDCINAVNFCCCFLMCEQITSIPENLFAYNIKVTDFSYTFEECYDLVNIPNNLFANNVLCEDFSSCFEDCSSLTDFTLHIGSSLVSDCSSFVDNKSGTTRTIYVPSGSTTQTTFNAEASYLGLTIIGE